MKSAFKLSRIHDTEARKCIICKNVVSYKKYISVAWLKSYRHVDVNNFTDGVVCRGTCCDQWIKENLKLYAITKSMDEATLNEQKKKTTY